MSHFSLFSLTLKKIVRNNFHKDLFLYVSIALYSQPYCIEHRVVFFFVHLLFWCFSEYSTAKFPGFSLVNWLIKLDIYWSDKYTWHSICKEWSILLLWQLIHVLKFITHLPYKKIKLINYFCIHTMDNTLNDCSKTENFAFSHGQKYIFLQKG